MTDDMNDPIAMLRHELESVSPSTEFAARVRERLADDLEPLRAELAELTPTGSFAARVRQGIEQADASRSSWSRITWRWIVPATGLAAAAIAAVMLWPRQAPEPARPTNEVARVEPVAPPAVSSSSPQVARPASRVLSRTPRVPAAGPRIEAAQRDPMLEVITDQPALLRALSVRVQPGVSVDSTEPTGNYLAPKIEVAPIEIAPISLFVLPETRVPIGVTPFILRVTAESAERNSK